MCVHNSHDFPAFLILLPKGELLDVAVGGGGDNDEISGDDNW